MNPIDTMASAESPKSSKLENLPKDDLIKFVKKQMLMLQKTRVKCDELTKELSAKAELTSGNGDTRGHDIELEQVAKERDDAVKAYQDIQLQNDNLNATVIELKEQLSNQELVNKSKTSSENEMLSTENKSLIAKLQEAEVKLLEENQTNEKLTHNFKVLKQRYLTAKKESADMKQNADADERLAAVQTLLDKEKETVNALQAELSSLTADNRELTEAVHKMSEISAMKEQMDVVSAGEVDEKVSSEGPEAMEKLNNELGARLAELEAENEMMKQRAQDLVMGLGKESAETISLAESKVAELEQTVDNLTGELKQKDESIATYEQQLHVLRDDMKVQSESSQAEKDELTATLESANQKLHTLETQAVETQSDQGEINTDNADRIQSLTDQCSSLVEELNQSKQQNQKLEDQIGKVTQLSELEKSKISQGHSVEKETWEEDRVSLEQQIVGLQEKEKLYAEKMAELDADKQTLTEIHREQLDLKANETVKLTAKIESQRESLVELEERDINNQELLSTKQGQLEDLENELRELQVKLKSTIAESGTVAQVEIERLTSTNEDLQQNETKLREELQQRAELAGTLEELTRKLAEVQNSSEEKDNKILNLEEIISRLENECVKLNQTLIQTENLKTEKDTELANLVEIVKRLENECAKLNQTLIETETMKSTQQRRLEQIIRETEEDALDTEDKLMNLVTEKEKRISDLDLTIDQLRTELEVVRFDGENSIQSRLHELTVELSESQAVSADLRCQLHTKCDELNALVQKKDEALEVEQQKNEEIQTISSTFQQRIEELQCTNEELRSESLSLKQINDTLTGQIQKLHVEFNQANNFSSERINDFQTTNQELADECRVLKEQLSQSNGTSDVIVQEKTALEETTREMHSALQTLQEKLTANEEAKEEISNVLRQTEMEKSELTNQISVLQQELETVRQEVMETSMSSQQSATAAEESSEEAAVKFRELETKCNKFKMLALKAKKELMESKKVTEKLNQELESRPSVAKLEEAQKTMQNYQMLQQSFDSIHDELDASKVNVNRLTQELEAEKVKTLTQLETVSQLIAAKEKLELNVENAQTVTTSLESRLGDVGLKLTSVESERDSKQQQIEKLKKELSQAQDDVKHQLTNHRVAEEKSQEKINQLQVKVQEARDELEHACKKATKTNLMDLEIADFEKTVQRLQEEIGGKESEISSIKEEFSHLQQKHASLESQMDLADEQRSAADERCEKLKQMLVKVKAELTEARQSESDQKSADAAVRGELEALRLEHESLKVQTSQHMSGITSAEEKVRNSQEAHQRLVRSMENKQRSLQTDLSKAESDLTQLQQEYDSYKVRVHSVLKQQQTRAKVEAALENEKVEREHVENVLEQVRGKLQEMSDKLEAALAESSLLQEELDKLSLKHNRVVQEATNKEGVMRQRVDQLMMENAALATEHSASLQQANERHQLITDTLREQITVINTEHQVVVSSLRNEVTALQSDRSILRDEMNSLQQQISYTRDSTVVKQQQRSSRHAQQATEPEQPDLRSVVRESGEGMEQPDAATNVRKVAVPTVGLEQLLTQESWENASVRSTGEFTDASEEEAKLKIRLTELEKSQDHLRTLLNESEAECTCYSEQVKLLKSEIRRLEANQQREDAISNMEYLKNVVYKFVSLPAGDEKTQLLPVLETMLKFTADEQIRLKGIAQGVEQQDGAQGQGSGWGSYMHRWTGFSS